MTANILFLGATHTPSARSLTTITNSTVTDTYCYCGTWTKPLFVNDPSPSEPYADCNLSNLESISSCRALRIDHDVSRYSIRSGSTLESICEAAASLWPGMDVMVRAVRADSLMPATDLCYDILVKPSPIPGSIPVYLTKLTVFFRHADRYPTGKIPYLEDVLANQGITYESGQLMPKGRDAALAFGQKLRQVYDLSPIIADTVCTSSPVRRCVETAALVLQGLGIMAPITIAPVLNFSPVINTDRILDQLPKLREVALDMIEQTSVQLALSYVPLPQAWSFFVVSKLMNIMTAYEGLGLDIDQFLGADLWFELKVVGTAAANWLFRWLAERNQEAVRAVLDLAAQSSGKLVLCSTHDTVLFTLAQYYRLKYDYPTDIEVPGYLASIRIELWSDGSERVFYNNRLMN